MHGSPSLSVGQHCLLNDLLLLSRPHFPLLSPASVPTSLAGAPGSCQTSPWLAPHFLHGTLFLWGLLTGAFPSRIYLFLMENPCLNVGSLRSRQGGSECQSFFGGHSQEAQRGSRELEREGRKPTEVCGPLPWPPEDLLRNHVEHIPLNSAAQEQGIWGRSITSFP